MSLSLCLPFSTSLFSTFLFLPLSLFLPYLSLTISSSLFVYFFFSTSTYPFLYLFFLPTLSLTLHFFMLVWLFKENGLSKVERMMIILSDSSPDSVMKLLTQNIHRILKKTHRIYVHWKYTEYTGWSKIKFMMWSRGKVFEKFLNVFWWSLSHYIYSHLLKIFFSFFKLTTRKYLIIKKYSFYFTLLSKSVLKL